MSGPEVGNIGALFDWDGVIIDSHDQHEQSWQELFVEMGRPMPADFFKKTFGMRNGNIIPQYFDWIDPEDTAKIAELGDRKETLYRDLIVRDGIDPLPGAADLLSALHDASVPCSVASSAPRKNIDVIMEIIGLRHRFAAITSAEDVSNGKPDPDVFQKAAQKIDRSPGNCIVFEDALVGIKAGLAAGAKVIAVATTHGAASLTDADLVLSDLTQVTIEKMQALLER